MPPNPMSLVFSRGRLVDLQVCYFPALRKLTPKDLGLTSDDLPEKFYSLGRKRLLPRECIAAFKNIESSARRIIKPPTGTKFPCTSNGWFIPESKIAEVDDQLAAEQDRFQAAVQAFLDRYPAERRSMMDEWAQQLEKLSKRLNLEDPETWASEAMDKIESLYPTDEEIALAFEFRWDWLRVTLPGTEEETGARREIFDRYKRDAEARIKSFLESLVSGYRRAAVELCEKWTSDLKADRPIHHRRLEELRGFLGRFRELNWVGDQVVAGHLDAVERLLPVQVGEINGDGTQEIRSRLQTALDGVSAAAGSVGNSPRAVVATFLGTTRAVTKA